MIVDKNVLEKKVLFEPALTDGFGCSTLKIITGYTDIGRISSHMIALKDGVKEGKYVHGINVEIILGMAMSNGLSKDKHEKIVATLNELNSFRGMPKVKCYYVVKGFPVHSKVYIWEKESKPICAYCGSANYSMNAFGNRSRQREYMTVCDPNYAVKYFNEIKKDCIDSQDACAVAMNITFPPKVNSNYEVEDDELNLETLNYDYFIGKTPVDTITVSLLKSESHGGDVGHGSGLNWGIRPNGTERNKDQAYIPYNKPDRKKGFFPDERLNGEANWPIFKVVTKERGAFFMRVAQGDGKALETPQSNAILGAWIRNILKLESGVFITKEMLEEYGKTFVTFKKYNLHGEDIYTLDF